MYIIIKEEVHDLRESGEDMGVVGMGETRGEII